MNNRITSVFCKKQWILFVLISFMFAYLSYALLGFYYSEYEGLNIGFLSGSLTQDLPFRSLYFSGNLVISYFYSFLYEWIPHVEWISSLECFWILLSCALSFYLITHQLPTSVSPWRLYVLYVFVFCILFAGQYVNLIYTRVAYIVCGMSLIGLVVLFKNNLVIRQRRVSFLLLNCFFVIGTLIRNEAAIACVMLIIPFSFAELKSPKQVVLLFLFPVIIVTTQTGYLMMDIATATDYEFYKQVEPDIEEQFIARGNLKPLSTMTTYHDSVKYKLASEMAFSDPAISSPTYLRSLIIPEDFLFTDKKQWKRVWSEQTQIVSQYWHLVLLTLILSITYFYNSMSDKKEKLSSLLFVLSFWLFSIIQTYIDKVNERSWVPYIGLFVFCHVLLLIRQRHVIKRITFCLLVMCIAVLFVVQLVDLKVSAETAHKNLLTAREQFGQVKKLAHQKILVTNSSAFNMLFASGEPFKKYDFSAFKKVYILDSYIIPFFPYYKRYLERNCACSVYEYSALWSFLKQNKQELILLSTRSRSDAVKNYLREIHKLDINLRCLTCVEKDSLDWQVWHIDP